MARSPIETLKRGTAALVSLAMVLTTPGLPLYAAVNEAVTGAAPVGTAPVVPLGTAGPGGVSVEGQAGRFDPGMLGGRGGRQTFRPGRPKLQSPSSEGPADGSSVSVPQDAAASESQASPSPEPSPEPENGARHLFPEMVPGTISDAGQQPALHSLTKPNSVKQLPPQASVEQVFQAGDRDIRRITLEKEGYAAKELTAQAPIASPLFRPKAGRGARRAVRDRGTATAFDPSSGLRPPSPALRAEEGNGGSAAPQTESRPVSYIKEGAVKAWEATVALEASRFLEGMAAAPFRKAKQAVLKDAPATGAGYSRTERRDGSENGPPSLSQPSATLRFDSAHHTSPASPGRGGLADRQERSALFPALLGGMAAAAWGGLKLAAQVAGVTPPAGGAAVQPVQYWHYLLQVGATALLYGVAAFAAWTVAELVLYGVMGWVGKGVTREEAEAFLVRDARARPHLYRGLLGVKPGTGVLKFAFDKELRPFGVFAFTLPNAIFLRPELVRMPWLFRIVLRHELHHFTQALGRAPPARRTLFGRTRSIFQEAGAHLFEILPTAIHLPRGYLLDRVLSSAQLSLRLDRPVDILLAGRDGAPIGAADFKWVSGGKARVQPISAADEQSLTEKTRAALRDPANAGRFRALLIDGMQGWLPQGQDARKLEMTFQRMNRVAQERLAHLRARPMSFDPKAEKPERLWDAVRSPAVEQLELVRFLDDLYRALEDKGFALLPFAPGDPALGPVEKLFAHWTHTDRGYFRVTRVDLAEGGHVLVAQKSEPRVRVYLKPANGAKVATSIDSVYRDPVKRAAGEAVLRHIGLEEWLPTFREIGLEVVHVQGEDVADTMVYVSLPRSKLRFIEALVAQKQVSVVKPEYFELHRAGNGLYQSVPRQNGPEAWKAVGGAQGMTIYSDDTGAWAGHPYFGGRVTALDVVDEGPEDYHGHGTQTMGDALSGGDRLKGPAYEAKGVMVKVFPKGSGASDGDIRAGWGKAQQGGADVLYMSLGSPGTVDSPLARDASGLTRRKNSKGQYPIVFVSAGNSGPDAEKIGAPGTGEEVITVAAATKGRTPDDASKAAALQIALYSSPGWAYANHGYGLRPRAVMKPEITGEVGTVNTPDAKGDVYKFGLTSPRSRDAEDSPSDSPDRLETKAAGTSFSAPEAAGVAALVKAAFVRAAGRMKRAAKSGADRAAAWIWDNLPFSVKMWLMVSAEDLRAPVQKMGAGLLDMGAAVKAVAATLRPKDRGGMGWEWLKDARRVVDLPRKVWEKAAAAGRRAETTAAASPETQARAKRKAREAARAVLRAFGKENRDAARRVARETARLAAERAVKHEAGMAAQKAAALAFQDASADSRKELTELLRHEVWIIRLYALFAAMNLRDGDLLPVLSDLSVKDSDPRVRQMAIQAIVETAAGGRIGRPTLEAVAARDAAIEVRAYALMGMARSGDQGAVKALTALLGHPDLQVRYDAAWNLGYIGGAADAAVGEALSALAADTQEIDSNRHEAIAALGRLVEHERAVTPKVVADLLGASGKEEMIVTRTAHNSFFARAAESEGLRRLMAADPARKSLLAFIEKYRAFALKRGAVGDLVRLLARLTGTEIGTPMPADPSGQGVPGVDENIGPVHLAIELPKGKAVSRTVLRYAGSGAQADALTQELAGVEFPTEVVTRLGGTVRAALKEGFVTVELPGYSVPAFKQQMALKGFLVSRATPKYLFLRDTGPLSGLPEVREKLGVTGVGSVVLVIDEGLETGNPAFAEKVLGAVNTSGEGASDDVSDESVGHGTHTGNIAAGAQRPDGNPNIGRAPDAFVIAAKVLGRFGGSEATVQEGISAAMQILDDVNAKLAAYWKAKDAGEDPALPGHPALKKAIAKGIRRFEASINLSLGGPGQKESPLNVQLRRLHVENRAMVSVAAGNDGPGEGTANETSPANERTVKTVGSLSKKKQPEFYSSEGTDSDPIVKISEVGGDAVMGNACPFLPGGVISALAAKAAEAAARCIVPHKGKNTDQAMSGTSMASPHSAGDDALILQRLRKHFTDAEIAQAKGLFLWLDLFAYKNAERIEGAKASKVGAGFRQVKVELEKLDETLKDKPKVLAEAAELYKKEQALEQKASAVRWAGVGPVGIVRRSLWGAAWEAVKAPFGRWMAKAARDAAKRAGNGAVGIPRESDFPYRGPGRFPDLFAGNFDYGQTRWLDGKSFQVEIGQAVGFGFMGPDSAFEDTAIVPLSEDGTGLDFERRTIDQGPGRWKISEFYFRAMPFTRPGRYRVQFRSSQSSWGHPNHTFFFIVEVVGQTAGSGGGRAGNGVRDTLTRPDSPLRPSSHEWEEGVQNARDLEELRRLRELLDTGGGRMTPFVFRRSPDGPVAGEAPSAGLEGFVFAKRRLEAAHGADAFLHHLNDYLRYLQTLLEGQEWSRALREELRRLELDGALTPAQKNEKLNAVLKGALAPLQTRVSALDKAAWARTARVYELFPRAYNLHDKRLAGPWRLRLYQKTLDRLEKLGLRKPRKFFADVTVADLKQIKDLGFDAVWTMGIHPIGERNRGGSAGGSPYSISDFLGISPELGTLEDYRTFVRKAHRAGLKVIADFVPNDTSMDSRLLAAHPEFFIGREAGPGEPPPGHFRYRQPGTGREFDIHHGGSRYDSWTDTAQVDISRQDMREELIAEARTFVESTDIDGYRVDMAHLLQNSEFGGLWNKRMPQREFLEQLATELKTARRGFALIAEAYMGFEAISAAGFDVTYNKTDFYDALRSKDPARIERALQRVAFHVWKHGGATGLQFASNHDEDSPQRAFGKFMRAALFLALLLPGAQLLYGSQEIGYDRPAPGDGKPIPFSEPRRVDWLGADKGIASFYRSLFLQSRRLRALRAPEMKVLEGGGAWTGYALGSPESDTVFAVLANPADHEVEVRIDRPDLGIRYGATLAASDAVVVSFPAPVREAPAGRRLLSAPAFFGMSALSVGSLGLSTLGWTLRGRGPLLLGQDFASIAQGLSFPAFFAFLFMMVPQTLKNWANLKSRNFAGMRAVSPLMMALAIAGNGLNFAAFLLSGNPWWVIGAVAGIITTWLAALPLYLARDTGPKAQGH